MVRTTVLDVKNILDDTTVPEMCIRDRWNDENISK